MNVINELTDHVTQFVADRSGTNLVRVVYDTMGSGDREGRVGRAAALFTVTNKRGVESTYRIIEPAHGEAAWITEQVR